MAFPVYFWLLFAVAMAVSAIGFKKYVWFISLGYGFSIAAEGVAMLLLYGKTLSLGTVLSTAIVFPLIMVGVLWPLGLDGLWLNQAATYVPVGIIAFCMLRKTQKQLASRL